MPEVKMLEIRDRATCIPAMAVALKDSNPKASRILWRAGFTPSGATFIHLTHLSSDESHYAPYNWGRNSRTMKEAHDYIAKEWDNIATGDVIDVEFILGESPTPKESEINV